MRVAVGISVDCFGSCSDRWYLLLTLKWCPTDSDWKCLTGGQIESDDRRRAVEGVQVAGCLARPTGRKPWNVMIAIVFGESPKNEKSVQLFLVEVGLCRAEIK